jgi:hypothetical protein
MRLKNGSKEPALVLVAPLPPHPPTHQHHAEGLVNPTRTKKVTDFGYPRACRFRKRQIENIGSRSLLYQLFSKRDF